MENNTKESITATQKRSRGRPKTGFNQIEYNKQYRENVLKNNIDLKNKVLESNKKYKASLKKALDLIKLMNQNGDVLEKYKDKVQEILV